MAESFGPPDHVRFIQHFPGGLPCIPGDLAAAPLSCLPRAPPARSSLAPATARAGVLNQALFHQGNVGLSPACPAAGGPLRTHMSHPFLVKFYSVTLPTSSALATDLHVQQAGLVTADPWDIVTLPDYNFVPLGRQLPKSPLRGPILLSASMGVAFSRRLM